jgi:hypothetical protein
MQENMRRARQLERELKALLKGELTPGSGNKRQKGDVKSGLFLAEAKYRTCLDPAESLSTSGFASASLSPLLEQFPFDVGWLETITTQAGAVDKIAVLALEWTSGRRVVMVACPDMDALLPGESTGCPLIRVASRCPNLVYPVDSMRVYRFEAMTGEPREWLAYRWEPFARLRRELDREQKEKKRCE